MNSSRSDAARLFAVATYTDIGGAEVLLCEMLAGVQREGIDVTLFVFGSGAIAARAEELGLALIVGRQIRMSRPATVIRGVRALRAALATARPTVVHASNPKARLIASLAMAGRSVPCTTQVLDRPPRHDPFVGATRRMPGHRFAITDDAASAWRSALRGQSVEVVTPGVDIAAQAERAARGDASATWSRAGITDAADHARIVMVARLQRYKGPFDLVEAAADVLREQQIRVLLVGPDEPFEPNLREQLRDEIERRGLSAVIGLAGTISTDDLAATMRDATLLVHPAHHETFGLVVLEALSLGTPVIAYAAPGPAAILRAGGGILVAVGDTTGLAAEIVRSLGDPSLLAELRAQAPTVAAGFAAATMVDAYAVVFRSFSAESR